MSRNSSSNARLREVFRRGKKFWCRFTYEETSYRSPLKTGDRGEAIDKATQISQSPVLAGPDPLKDEIDRFLARGRSEARASLVSIIFLCLGAETLDVFVQERLEVGVGHVLGKELTHLA